MVATAEENAESRMVGGIGHPDLQLLYRYWLGKRAGRRVPARADINPIELPARLWPNLMLLDLLCDGPSLLIHFRLTGTHIDRAFGRNATGEFFNEQLVSNARYRTYIQALYEEIVGSGMPVYSENIFQLAIQPVPMLTRRLSLPLADDGVNVDMALVGAMFEYPRQFDDQFSSGFGYSTMLASFSEIARHRLFA